MPPARAPARGPGVVRQSAAEGQPPKERAARPLAPLFARDDVAWYSLQREDGEDQIPGVPAARDLHLLDERNDFDGKAALITALDLVVSVCTSSAHLAGALGRPLWVELTHVPELAMGLEGTTSAWYPHAPTVPAAGTPATGQRRRRPRRRRSTSGTA